MSKTQMKSSTYHPEEYWSDVARRTSARPDGVIAGDDEPFYRYKRAQFLKMLHKIDFSGKKVLEVGPGPGGNLREIINHHKPKSVTGADISQDMIDYARTQLPEWVELQKINGTELPFQDRQFDIAMTVTVLQHNTDETMLKQIIQSICRCTDQRIYLFERIEKTVKGDELNMGRPVHYYEEEMKNGGFKLDDVSFLNVSASYYMAGVTRKLLNSTKRKEAEPLSGVSLGLQNVLLPVTKMIDPMFPSNREFAQLSFIRD